MMEQPPNNLRHALQRIRKLERALEPFAREATEWASSVPDNYRAWGDRTARKAGIR